MPQHNVRIASDCKRSLARKQTKEFCRRGAGDLHKSIHAPAALHHAALIRNVHSILDARHAVRNLGEISLPHRFLLQRERTMIGGDGLQRVIAERAPQGFLIRALTNWRRANIFRAVKTFVGVLFGREGEILRTRFAKSRDAARARRANLFHRKTRRDVDDVHGDAGKFRQRDATMRRFGFRRVRSREGMIVWRRFTFR